MAKSFNATLARLVGRRDTIRDWIMAEASQTGLEQAHLDPGCSEHAYWHHGYQAALDDVIHTLMSTNPTAHIADSSTS